MLLIGEPADQWENCAHLIACERKVRRAFVMDMEAYRCDSIIRRFIRETEFGYMPMLLRRDGKPVLHSLREICENDKKLRPWFKSERKRFSHPN